MEILKSGIEMFDSAEYVGDIFVHVNAIFKAKRCKFVDILREIELCLGWQREEKWAKDMRIAGGVRI